MSLKVPKVSPSKNVFHFGHTGELSQLENIILDILSQLQTLYKEHSVKERGWLFLRHSAWLSLILSLTQPCFYPRTKTANQNGIGYFNLSFLWQDFGLAIGSI